MNKKKETIILLTIIFLILTFVKLFTAKVGLLGDPTVLLVLKANPTISNTFQMTGEDNQVNREKYEGTWYYNGKYKVLIPGDEGKFSGELIYDFVIAVWWILLIGVPVYMVIYKANQKDNAAMRS